jgi:hypothetical protein
MSAWVHYKCFFMWLSSVNAKVCPQLYNGFNKTMIKSQKFNILYLQYIHNIFYARALYKC